MPDPQSKPPSAPRRSRELTPEERAQLISELKAPYRGLRQVIYLAFGASGGIGALVFLAQMLSGQDVRSTLPNFALQVGILALMVWLFRLEWRAGQKKQR